MVGCVLGIVGAALLVKGIFRARRYAYYSRHGGTGGGCGSGGCGHHGWHGGGRWGRTRFDADRHEMPGGWDEDRGGDGPILLRGVFERLRTTPGQERVIVEALRELKTAFKKAAEDGKKAAGDISEAMRGDDLSTESMGNAFAHLDGATETVRTAAFATLSKIHDALDPSQRKVLADFLKRPRGLEDLAQGV